jgi:uroporphyrinogen decarboxylase
MDLVLNPDLVHYCLDQLFDFCYENTRRIYEQIPGQVTFSYVAEDLGAQENLLFSPEIIREFLLPRMKRMIDLAHEAGVYAFCHSDGAIRRIIPDLIEIGIDILNPIQWRCKGMVREELKRDFGTQVVLHGGVDNQYTLAFGNEDEVREEVMHNIDVLGADGGYILAPCHNIQAVSPPENVAAMYRTGYEYGQYY